MRVSSIILLACVLYACGGLLGEDVGEVSQAISLPSGFTQTEITGISEPTAFAFLPDGRMLVTSRSGKVRVIKNGQLRSTAALDLGSKTCPQRERGLLGVAVDPDFATNKFVYLFYTRKKNHCDLHDQSGNGAINRVSRFKYDLGNDTLSDEKVLVDHILAYNGWHNGGDIQFGSDGFLYISVGDAGAKLGGTSTGWSNNNSRHKSLLNGKILRVVKDTGAPAPGNPWTGGNSRRCGDPSQPGKFPANSSEPCQETYAWGLRNPFRMGFKPGTNTLFINEVGQNIGGDWEEINEGKANADYGWNKNQGPTSDAATTPPVYAYKIGEQVGGKACRSITGGAFVPDGAFPASYDGAYFFGDYVCGALFYIKKDGNTWKRTTFATELGNSSVVHLGFGPSPSGGTSMYYTSFEGGKVVRIDPPSSGNNPPTAKLSASPRAGALPLTVSFDGSESFDNDPNDGISRYVWSFGDGSPEQSGSSPTVQHTYTTAGRFTAKLTVEDRRSPKKRASATLEVQPGNAPPTLTINTPSNGQEFVVGATLKLKATGVDAEDGTLPASAIAWNVKRVHDDHTHPFLSATGNDVSLVPEGPEGLQAAETSHYTITATVTDSAGLTATKTITIEPKLVDLTFATAPAGLALRVDDTDLRGSTTVRSWEGYKFKVRASAQTTGGKTYAFESWSDGGQAEHDVTTPASARTYTATFRESTVVARINFQLDSAVTPEGYLKDNGAKFGTRAGGFKYGWNQDNQFAARERNNPSSPDKRYDTTVLFQKMGNKFWEMELPNGSYDIFLVAGDANHFDSTFDITAEGKTVLSGKPTTQKRWLEASATVTVSDGRLTLDNGATAQNNKICFIDIKKR